jgi:hypothetical protein
VDAAGDSETLVDVPIRIRLRFGRAAAQFVADEVSADLLHIKGNAVDPVLRETAASGSDVDVMVRPAHIERFDRALRAHGWEVYSTFLNGSPFGHAQTYLHPHWGYLDVHRLFPGIRLNPEAAFDRLWKTRSDVDFTGITCSVPDVTAQSIILVLNTARDRGRHRIDLRSIWYEAPDDRRAKISRLVAEFHAEVAFAAAVGELGRYRRRREYLLWKVSSQGGSRFEEWWGRVRAEQSLGGAVRTLARAPLVNIDTLSHRLGRRPTAGEVVREFFARPLRATRHSGRGNRRRTAGS